MPDIVMKPFNSLAELENNVAGLNDLLMQF